MLDDVLRARRRRVAGLLVGIAVADGWSQATEVALCVADAAATGLALDDARAIDLLRRNLRSRRLETDAGDRLDDDAVRAASAVVAAAHHGDDEAGRHAALTAVWDVLEVAPASRDGLSSWSHAVAEAVATGSVDSIPSPAGDASPLLELARDTVNRMRSEPFAPRAQAARLLVDSPESAEAPAATGALVGALFGVEALPPEAVARLSGWPDADAYSLIEVAADVAAPRERGLPGVPLPTDIPAAGVSDAASDPPARGERAFRVVRVALTAKDTVDR